MSFNISAIYVGDRVRFKDGQGGHIRGEIRRIFVGKDFDGQLIPYLDIEYIYDNKEVLIIIPGTSSELEAVEFRVNFRGPVC